MLRLVLYAAGIYASFLSWALIQERLSTTPYADPAHPLSKPRYFRHVIFLNTVQSLFSALAATIYLAIRKRKSESWRKTIGLETPVAQVCPFQ
jgi:UDP-galactose transporter B1